MTETKWTEFFGSGIWATIALILMGSFRKKEGKNAEEWSDEGKAFVNSERYKEAIKCFDKALDTDPKNAAAWNNKGVALDKLERYEEAIRCYDKALDIDSKDAAAWSNKGYDLVWLERYEEAIRCCDKALDIDPKNAAAWYNKGILLGELKRHEKEIRCYDKALAIDPKYENAKINKKLAEKKLKDKRKWTEPFGSSIGGTITFLILIYLSYVGHAQSEINPAAIATIISAGLLFAFLLVRDDYFRDVYENPYGNTFFEFFEYTIYAAWLIFLMALFIFAMALQDGGGGSAALVRNTIPSAIIAATCLLISPLIIGGIKHWEHWIWTPLAWVIGFICGCFIPWQYFIILPLASVGYVIGKPISKRAEKRAEEKKKLDIYKAKIEQWEWEGYEVSEWRERWFK